MRSSAWSPESTQLAIRRLHVHEKAGKAEYVAQEPTAPTHNARLDPPAEHLRDLITTN
ncbi:hypothetical protein GII33_00275 [Gordonia pseudamarae]|jgi:hypothetical protein|uniref:Transposase n=1 Tax=Gordonia pseudamarae TaxID=2831662 RepID=A0ABX6IC46_9ACTN|nr:MULTISPECIES: hypothetical protein [Gordonia]MBD0024345.1 hypothetical protein [Gordonia sp. (in: high G+C Gram-positive bacteria)]QHN24643.1 hypothetical protein GII33_00275 [Gordonia pseudamarae]QHN33573.1 hypothetical protein GII31_00270 [Gordonia pseudamarae]